MNLELWLLLIVFLQASDAEALEATDTDFARRSYDITTKIERRSAEFRNFEFRVTNLNNH